MNVNEKVRLARRKSYSLMSTGLRGTNGPHARSGGPIIQIPHTDIA